MSDGVWVVTSLLSSAILNKIIQIGLSLLLLMGQARSGRSRPQPCSSRALAGTARISIACSSLSYAKQSDRKPVPARPDGLIEWARTWNDWDGLVSGLQLTAHVGVGLLRSCICKTASQVWPQTGYGWGQPDPIHETPLSIIICVNVSWELVFWEPGFLYLSRNRVNKRTMYI